MRWNFMNNKAYYISITFGNFWLCWFNNIWLPNHINKNCLDHMIQLHHVVDSFLCHWQHIGILCEYLRWNTSGVSKITQWQSKNLMKSPWYTGGDFIYVFALVLTLPPLTPQSPPLLPATDFFCSCDNFWTTFRFLSFLAWLLALTYKLPN